MNITTLNIIILSSLILSCWIKNTSAMNQIDSSTFQSVFVYTLFNQLPLNEQDQTSGLIQAVRNNNIKNVTNILAQLPKPLSTELNAKEQAHLEKAFDSVVTLYAATPEGVEWVKAFSDAGFNFNYRSQFLDYSPLILALRSFFLYVPQSLEEAENRRNFANALMQAGANPAVLMNSKLDAQRTNSNPITLIELSKMLDDKDFLSESAELKAVRKNLYSDLCKYQMWSA